MPNIKPINKLVSKARNLRDHHRERHTPSGFAFALADSIDYFDHAHWQKVTPNDSLFFHYSGHGGQTKDLDGDEGDGYDETIYPVDFRYAGHIVDDEIRQLQLREGGSLCDVAPTILGILGVDKPDNMTGNDLRFA